MNCIIADDEPLARKGLENYVNELPQLNLVALCTSAMEVMNTLAEKKVDLMFLDIQMPKMSGISLLKSLPNPPLTIITTAYQNYALEGYELSVTDYLVKPYSFDRFVTAVNKASQLFELQQQKNQGSSVDEKPFFFVKCDKSYEKIFFNDILYIEALQNYILINTAARKYIVYLTLKSIEEQLPPKMFLKINRSYIVNLHKVSSIDGNEVIVNSVPLQIGRSFKESVMQVLLNAHLIKR